MRTLRLEIGSEQHADDGCSDHDEYRRHEDVRRNGEQGTRLLDASKIEQGDDDNGDDGPPHVVLVDDREDGTEVCNSGGDGHGNGHDVVDQQCACYQDPPIGPEVVRDDFVVTTTTGIGMHRLSVRGHDSEVDEHNAGSDKWAPLIERQAPQREHQQDLLCCICIRGEGVTGKDWKRNLLGEEGLAQAIAAKSPTKEESLDRI